MHAGLRMETTSMLDEEMAPFKNIAYIKVFVNRQEHSSFLQEVGL